MTIKIPTNSLPVIFSLNKTILARIENRSSICPTAFTKAAFTKEKAQNQQNEPANEVSPTQMATLRTFQTALSSGRLKSSNHAPMEIT